ncbi:MAG: hypothetical protein JW891_09560 [Candidatus Lokiarchaeota archaeon]|nr:hypothetical protein [Candidatus Lokiarchaeota archaeon]
MLIKKIELQNITTHKRTTIEFQEGLNMLLGQNGTGKSTILNMIGYVLFNYLPGNQKSYVRTTVRKTPKYGVIKLWVVGLNDDVFIVERTIGKQNNAIEISDARTGVLIQNIDNKSDLIAWLKTQFSLRKDLNLSNIFETSIGIPQGTFTEPFLRTPTERMKFFNPILNVDVYRNIYEKGIKLVNLFKNEIQELAVEMGKLEGELKEKEETEQEIEQLKDEIKKLESDLETNEKELKQVSEKHDKLKKMEEKLKDLDLKQKELEQKLVSEGETTDLIKKNLLEARESEKICKQALSDHTKHKILIIKEKELQEHHLKLQAFKEQKTNSEKRITEFNAKIERVRAQIGDISSMKNMIPKLEENFNESEDIQKKIEELQGQIKTIMAYQENLDGIKEKHLENNKRKFELEDKLKVLPKIRSDYSQLEVFQNEYNQLNEKRITLDTEIAHLEENIKNSKGGNCPFLNEKCKNIEGNSLIDHFHKQLVPLKEELKSTINKLNEFNKKIEKISGLQQKIEQLSEDEGELRSVKKLYIEYINQIKELKEKVSLKLELKKRLDELMHRKEQLKSSIEQYQLYKEKINVELPKLQKEETELLSELKPLEKILKPLDKKINELKHVPEEFTTVKKELEKTIENYNKYQKSINIANKVPELEKELAKQNKLMENTKNNLDSIKKEIKHVLTLFNNEEFNETRIKKENLLEITIQMKTKIDEKGAILLKHEQKMEHLVDLQVKFEKLEKQRAWLVYSRDLTESLRLIYKEAGPKITEALLNKINQLASEIYRELTDSDAVQLKLEKDYNVRLITPEIEKEYNQLSGGEQMAVALSVRLSILKILTNADFAFFDEPTTNLDSDVRLNLAKCIQNIKGFKQLFIISHDDTFEESAENVIKFSKDEDEISHVQFLNS